jgi:hypothetical protein
MAIGEIVLRVTPLAKTSFYTYDSHLGWTLKPGARGWQRSEGNAWLRVNRWGYRGPDWSLDKPSGTFRIAVLGDSFTQAQQVADDRTFCAVMQRELSRCPALSGAGARFNKIEVMNFGCDGYGTAQELIILRRRVWKFSPDLVLLAVFTGNDIRNNSVTLEGDKCRPFYVYRDGRLVLGGPFEDSLEFRLGCMMRFESRHFQVLNLLGSARSEIRAYLRARRAAAAAAHIKKPSLVELGISELIYRAPSSPVWNDAWRVTEAEIDEVQREVARHGAGLLVVTLANPAQDDPDPLARAAYAKRFGVSDLFYPDERISRLGEREGFPVLNLAQPMQAYAESHHAYLHGFGNSAPGSGHWNELGHEVAGRLIVQKICQMAG